MSNGFPCRNDVISQPTDIQRWIPDSHVQGMTLGWITDSHTAGVAGNITYLHIKQYLAHVYAILQLEMLCYKLIDILDAKHVFK